MDNAYIIGVNQVSLWVFTRGNNTELTYLITIITRWVIEAMIGEQTSKPNRLLTFEIIQNPDIKDKLLSQKPYSRFGSVGRTWQEPYVGGSMHHWASDSLSQITISTLMSVRGLALRGGHVAIGENGTIHSIDITSLADESFHPKFVL